MSDFLKRLAARSSGAEAIIRPRLASLFEPLSIGPAARFGTISEPFGEPPAVEATEMGFSGERLVSRIPEASPESAARPTMKALMAVPGPTTASGLAAEGRQRVQPTSLVSPVASEASPSPSAGSATRVSALEALSIEAAARSGAISKALDGPSLAEGSAHGLDRERIVNAAAQVPVSIAAGRAAATAQDAHEGGMSKRPAADSYGGRPRGLEPPQHQRPSLIPGPNPAGAILPPRIKVAAEFSRLQMPVQSREEREPTIHVTIGRVEVRAVSTPAPVSGKERSTPRVMSLDEYLQRRTSRGGQ